MATKKKAPKPSRATKLTAVSFHVKVAKGGLVVEVYRPNQNPMQINEAEYIVLKDEYEATAFIAEELGKLQ